MQNQKRHQHLRRRQLDETLQRLAALDSTTPPPRGWLREIRQSLGMSGTQLAARLRMTPAALSNIESAEVKRTVSLKTLDKVAAKLGCRVVYALLPPESLEQTLQTRARRLARRIVDRLSHTMELEEQKVSDREREHQIDEIADELVRTLSRDLWAEP